MRCISEEIARLECDAKSPCDIHPDGIFAICNTTRDGKGKITIVSGDDNHEKTISEIETTMVNKIKISPDGGKVALSYKNGGFRIVDIHSFTGSQNGDFVRNVTDIVWSHDSKSVVSIHLAGTIHIWTVKTAEVRATILTPRIIENEFAVVRTAIFSADDELVISCSDIHAISIWNSKSGDWIKDVCIPFIAFHITNTFNSEEFIVTSDSSSTIYIINIKNSKMRRIELSDDVNYPKIRKVTYHPDTNVNDTWITDRFRTTVSIIDTRPRGENALPDRIITNTWIANTSGTTVVTFNSLGNRIVLYDLEKRVEKNIVLKSGINIKKITSIGFSRDGKNLLVIDEQCGTIARIVIPQNWSIGSHALFPPEMRRLIRLLMMIATTKTPKRKKQITTIPKDTMMHIFSFLYRDMGSS
jgi:hypothetical protein